MKKALYILLFLPLYCLGQSVIPIPQHIISDVAGGSVVRLGTDTRSTDLNIVCDGNSLTLGTQQNTGKTYPKFLQDSIRAYLVGDTVYNLGVNSQTAGKMYSADADVVAKYSPLHRNNILIAWEITNNLFYGATSKGAMDSLKAYCLKEKARGFKVVVITCLPRTNVNADSITNANNKLKASYTQFADKLVDLTGTSELLDYNNTTYFTTDKIHLKEAGYKVVAKHVLDAIMSWAVLKDTKYNSAAEVLFARMTYQPNPLLKEKISQWYDTIQYYHIDDTLDVNYCFAVHDSADARLDWIRSTKSAIKVGVPAFTNYMGYTMGSSASVYLRAGYNPAVDAVHYRKNSASMAVYLADNVRGTNQLLHITGGASAYISTVGTTSYVQLNGTAAGSYANGSDIGGFTCTTRSSATNCKYARNANDYTNVTLNSTALPNQALGIFIGIQNVNGTPTAYSPYSATIAFVHIGGQLTAVQKTKLYQADERYMDAFGKGVN